MSALVETEWLAERIFDPQIRIVEINWDGLNDYAEGHLPGAVGWNWKSVLWDPYQREFPADADFAARLGENGITRNTTVVIYGAPVQFGTYAWWVLKFFGHDDVRILNGGKEKWRREGREIALDAPVFDQQDYGRPARMPDMRASREDVLGAIDNPETVILDHRSHEEYSGQRVGLPGKADVGAERYGRIPRAGHLPFDALLNEDTTFKTPAEIADLVKPHVGDRETPVISYCRLAHRATLASFAMTELLGFKNVRVYDGSWTEWGSMVGMPIER
ncbi:sulfurtransferase [Martelella alba]|nr:sulfurtransferase [Martelella alba]